MRGRMTPAERRLWFLLKNRGAGCRFRRQVPMGQWIVDFASLDPALVVEVDDISHIGRDESERTHYLNEAGFHVVRFTNEYVANELPAVVETIRAWVVAIRLTGKPPPEPFS